MTLTELIQPVQSHFDLFQEEYQHRTHSTAPLLKDVEEYLSHFLGKRLRPLMVLLSAEACGTMNSNHILVATIVEMLHNATLMHDDVVDESSLRRGHESVRHRWGNQVAVLCGDYYLARTMMALHEMNDSNATSIINNTVRTMCEGELKQLASANRPLDEDGYLDIIGSKTASLMSACCELGACNIGSTVASPYREALRNFGYHYGIVFQIRDDMHDTDIRHDATLQGTIDPKLLIDRHTRLAIEALSSLPDTPARQSLCSLLLPDAPQPTNQSL
ncbi:MAG: polyprenyl synthetase family protein [Bacteroidales bacterium]|nr:polyprenyl synthetase family protein [Bacteroidales bacterium]